MSYSGSLFDIWRDSEDPTPPLRTESTPGGLLSQPGLSETADISVLRPISNNQQRVKSPKKRFNSELDAQVEFPNKRPRTGPRLLPIGSRVKERVAIPKGPRHKSYTREFKLAIIEAIADPDNWVIDYRPNAPVREGLQSRGNIRPPTNQEVANKFNIPEPNIRKWWQKRVQILNSPGGSRRCPGGGNKPYWPALEKALYTEFVAERNKNRLISRGWFRRTSQRLFRSLYGVEFDFQFTYGWFDGFRKRWNIVRRRLTNQAQKLPTDQLVVVNSFLRFIRKVSWAPIGSRYSPAVILNLDETPVPFEFLDGYTYDLKGATTISGKSLRSGWGKRQATLIVYIFADGIKRCKPTLIFYGSDTTKSREEFFLDPRVNIEYNEKAYNNEELLLHWLETEYKTLRDASGKDHLLVLDQASFHRTPAVLNFLRANYTVPAVVPSGCTSLVQPLDTAVNYSLKVLIKEATERLTHEYEREGEGAQVEDWPLWKRRKLISEAVGEAWEKLNPAIIIKSFKQCGVNLDPQGSEDEQLRIKDLPGASFDGWQEQTQDPIEQLSKLEALVIKLEGEDEDLYEAGEGGILVDIAGDSQSTLPSTLPSTQRSGNSQRPPKKARKKYQPRPQHPTDYSLWTKEQLKDHLRDRGLRTTGNKAELVERVNQANMRERERLAASNSVGVGVGVGASVEAAIVL